ncbi:MAG: hypothetical protein IPK07_23175 [Deltaproteobacteria bacterium]|nr:hypothetical protein [Deltaproteobacteria bacterium]
MSPSTLQVLRTVPLGGSPGTVTVAGSVALVGDGGSSGCRLYAARTDTGAVLYDALAPSS